MIFKNIIFDFDGTLVNSKSGVVRTFQKVVEELVSRKAKEKEIIQLSGKPLVQIISILLHTNDKVLIKKGSDLFREYYSKEGIYQNIVYLGIKEMLELFKNQHCQLFVVSNKIEPFIIKILEQHDLKKYFIHVIGTSGTDIQSKKSDLVKSILTDCKLNRKETVMVGDTENDIMAARKNLIYSIGITWGYGLENDLIKAGVDKICHSVLDLEQFIIKNQ